MGRTYRLEREQVIPRPRAEVFAFFADAAYLERITPPFLHFRILTPLPIAMQPGALIDYRLGLFGLPVYWRTRIETWDPGRAFTDVQLRGPYRRWHHTHTFTDAPGGTAMRDVVDYELPLGPLGSLAHTLFVQRMLARIFEHRRVVIVQQFPPSRAGR